MGWAQGLTVDGVASGWWSVTSGIPQGSISGSVLSNTLPNDLDAGLEGVLSKFTGDTKLGGAVDSLKDWDLGKLKGWAITNLNEV